MATLVDSLLERYDTARSRRSKYNSVMMEAGQYAWPNAQDMVRNPHMNEGALRTVELFDSTALMSAYRMTSGFVSYFMPVGAQWFEFVPIDPVVAENPIVREWTSKATAITHKEIWRSNFQREMFVTIRSMIVFGTGVISVQKVDGELIFKSHHIGHMFFEENSKGEIDVIYRQIFYNVRQAVQEFEFESLSETIQKAFNTGKMEEIFEFVHIVFPNKDFEAKSITSKKIASIYISISDKKQVENKTEGKGFNEQPYLVARFSISPGEIMGRGPAIELLPEIKMLNRMKKTFIESSEKAVNPPLVVEDDGVIGQPVTSVNGIINIRSGAKFPEALKTGINVRLNAEILAAQQNVIREGFFNDLFNALAQHRNMTATEVVERVEEKIVHLAPAITALQKEIFSPLITRVLNLLIGVKRIPKAPVDTPLDIAYQGRLALAMSNMQTNAIEATLAKWQPYAEITPVFDNVKWNSAFRRSWINAGAPAEDLRDLDEVEAEQAQAKQAAQIAQASEVAETGSKAFRNVNETTQPDSLAGQLVA